MRTTLTLRRTLLAAALLLPACAESAPPTSTGGLFDALGEKRDEWEALDRAARAAYEAGRWEEAAARHGEKMRLFPLAEPGAPLDGRAEAILQTDLYNLACCRALAGKKAEALDTLERVFRDGSGTIGFDHLVQDPDLEALHGEARWSVLVSRLCADGPRLEPDGTLVLGKPWSGVVELLPAESDRSAGTQSLVTPTLRTLPPYVIGPGRFAWTSRVDSGARAANAVNTDVVFGAWGRALRTDLAGPEGRCVLRASGPEMVRLAWEVLLRRPDAFTHAVLDGPAPPARVLLDRGAEKLKTAILVADAKGVPDARVGLKVEVAGSAEEALRRALK